MTNIDESQAAINMLIQDSFLENVTETREILRKIPSRRYSLSRYPLLTKFDVTQDHDSKAIKIVIKGVTMDNEPQIISYYSKVATKKNIGRRLLGNNESSAFIAPI